MEEPLTLPPIVEEVSWMSAGKTTAYMYAILAVLTAIIMVVSTFTTCSKVHISSSIQLGLMITVVPALLYGLSTKYTFARKPFSSVFQKFGISEERSMQFAGTYILILILLPMIVYGVHSAEESACVATPDEMTAFKTKMLKELQEKQEAEEKNEKKK